MGCEAQSSLRSHLPVFAFAFSGAESLLVLSCEWRWPQILMSRQLLDVTKRLSVIRRTNGERKPFPLFVGNMTWPASYVLTDVSQGECLFAAPWWSSTVYRMIFHCADHHTSAETVRFPSVSRDLGDVLTPHWAEIWVTYSLRTELRSGWRIHSALSWDLDDWLISATTFSVFVH